MILNRSLNKCCGTEKRNTGQSIGHTKIKQHPFNVDSTMLLNVTYLLGGETHGTLCILVKFGFDTYMSCFVQLTRVLKPDEHVNTLELMF